MDSSNHALFVTFVALTAVSVFLQAAVLIGVLFSVRKAAKSVTEVTNDLKGTIVPVVHSTRALVERISPQVITLTAGLAELTEAVQLESKGVRISVSDISTSINEMVARLNRQTAHLDSMLTRGLDTVEHAGSVLESAVAVPVRQANGIAAAIKAMVDTYRTTVPRRRAVYPNAGYVDPIDPEI